MRLYILLILIIFSSCRTHKQPQTVIKQKDSIVYIQQVKVDTITIPSSSATAILPLTQLRDTVIIQQSTGQARAKIIVRDGRINCEAYCDSIWKLHVKTQTIYVKNSSNNQRTMVETSQKKCNGWMYFALGVMTSVVLFLLVFFLKNK